MTDMATQSNTVPERPVLTPGAYRFPEGEYLVLAEGRMVKMNLAAGAGPLTSHVSALSATSLRERVLIWSISGLETTTIRALSSILSGYAGHAAHKATQASTLRSHLSDLGQAILEKAEYHDWCAEYDEFAEEWDLPQREKDYVVHMTIPVDTRATSRDEAEERVQDWYDNYVRGSLPPELDINGDLDFEVTTD